MYAKIFRLRLANISKRNGCPKNKFFGISNYNHLKAAAYSSNLPMN